jgi:hypothetical protein
MHESNHFRPKRLAHEVGSDVGRPRNKKTDPSFNSRSIKSDPQVLWYASGFNGARMKVRRPIVGYKEANPARVAKMDCQPDEDGGATD